MGRTGIFKIFDDAGNIKRANRIIKKYKDQINEPGMFGVTPLSAAVRRECWNIAELLLDHGADIDLRDDRSQHVICDVLGTYRTNDNRNTLFKRMLLSSADVREKCIDILGRAIHKEDVDAVRICIEHNLTCRDAINIPTEICCTLKNHQCNHKRIRAILKEHMRCKHCGKVGEMRNVCKCYDFSRGVGLCGECFEIMKPAMKCAVCNDEFKFRVNLSNVEKFGIAFIGIMLVLTIFGRVPVFDVACSVLGSVILGAFVRVPFRDYVHVISTIGLFLALAFAAAYNHIDENRTITIVSVLISGAAMIGIGNVTDEHYIRGIQRRKQLFKNMFGDGVTYTVVDK